MCSQKAIGDALLELKDAGYLRQEVQGDWPVLTLTAKAQQEEPPADLISLAYKAGLSREAQRRKMERETWRQSSNAAAARLAAAHGAIDSAEAEDRFERLRLWRRTVAQREGVPPFMVFHDSVLRALAEAPIRTLADLRGVRGIGTIALNKHGADLLQILAKDAGGDADGV
jgi:superfamily II DNA helicase RecQ